MATPTPLRLLASTNNARGDLFTRLVKDLFFALGYDDLRLNVHKTGREIDIQGTHRLEPRRLVAECKAEKGAIGGDELNKFSGALGRERDRDKESPISGYFVSLNGFRESGKEQEQETSEQNRMILLDGARVVEELIRIGILIGRDEATERAGRCAAHAGLTAAALDGMELLGHELGYVWTVFYGHGKARTHFALIHADGTALAEAAAQAVIEADRTCAGSLHQLAYLAPPLPAPDRKAVAKSAVERYSRWVAEECGYIQLDGLPADADLSALRMRLERLFVPLKVVVESSELEKKQNKPVAKLQDIPIPVGELLTSQSRFSLLAKPGGGKTTLLKRLAVAYADPERRTAAADGLPARDWLPLFLRCRELRDRVHRPVLELLRDLPQHAGMNGEEAEVFRDQLDEALRAGRALLLVDGLDEISDEGARTAFANHLRTFLGMFPGVAMVVTSREAGFRQVAGVIASACRQTRLAPFDEADVRRLCESWHVEVVGDSEKVRTEARQLADTIWSNERIRALAENPLMLTTLLVVRRCIGELPTRRVELYREAVRVLIRTWNTEGFEALDLEEALAQLSYVACTMMNEGVQQIGYRQLLKLLREAREELQAELQFSRISPAEFIERIEYRSSLLMQTGQERIDGELQPVYEFRHLTFQEYLAARGLVEEQYPGRDAGKSLVELLEPHFEDERWREVIPLAAVLAGRKAELLIQRLTEMCRIRAREVPFAGPDDANDSRVVLLRQCLLDEAQVTPSILREALRQMARHGNESYRKGSVVSLRRGKFGEAFQQVSDEAYCSNDPGWEEYTIAVRDLAAEALFKGQPPVLTEEIAVRLEQGLRSKDRIGRVCASFMCMCLAWKQDLRSVEVRDVFALQFQPLYDALGDLLSPTDPPVSLAATWALALLGDTRFPGTPSKLQVIQVLYRLWREAESSSLREFAAWAFSAQPLLPRDSLPLASWGDSEAGFEQATATDLLAVLVLAWYRRAPWTDDELVEKLSQAMESYSSGRATARELLATLGEPGQRMLKKWERLETLRRR